MRKVLMIAAVIAFSSVTLSSCAEEELPTPEIVDPMNDNTPKGNCPPEGCD